MQSISRLFVLALLWQIRTAGRNSLLDAQLVLVGDLVDTRRVGPHGVLCLLGAASACMSVHLNITRCILCLFAARPHCPGASAAEIS